VGLAGEMTRDEVIESFFRAVKTLQVLPDRERGFFQLRSGWPSYVREFMDAYDPNESPPERFEPTPHDVSVFLDVLAWGKDLDRKARQIIIWRAAGASYRTIGSLLDVSYETARQRFEDAINQIWATANAKAAPDGVAEARLLRALRSSP
jgi:DNA-directed RNA polymerase specialized sigma24 family protein